MLVDLLHREAALRKSSKVQDDMEMAEESVQTEWMDVIAALQRSIVDEHNSTLSGKGTAGATRNLEMSAISVTDLRIAALRHPEVAFWVKYNRARRGDLKVGDEAPDVPLRRAVDGTETYLLAPKGDSSASITTNTPLVVFAGSLS